MHPGRCLVDSSQWDGVDNQQTGECSDFDGDDAMIGGMVEKGAVGGEDAGAVVVMTGWPEGGRRLTDLTAIEHCHP